MTANAFRAFVFDLDGTLIDTASELVAVYHRMCVELGNGEKPFDDARKLISYGSGRLVTEATGIEEEIRAGSPIVRPTWIGTRKSSAPVQRPMKD